MKKYYKKLDILRILSCVGVLLYHLGVLKGGYLAVCTFLVMSGYLAIISATKKEKFSIINYYINRLHKIYLPFLVIVLITVGIVSLIPSVNWLNLKPETTSVLLGYNNYWQLKANSDYFARQLSSPFTHFWYMGILLQFDLIFPFLFVLLKGCKNKISKHASLIISSLLTIGACLYFYKQVNSNNVMLTYYDTLSRVFSIMLGLTVGIIHSDYKKLIPKFLIKYGNWIYYLYVLIFIVMCITIDSGKAMFIGMFIMSLLTCRMIDYATISSSKKIKGISAIADVTYEVYLVQYPVLFIYQALVSKTNSILNISAIILLTIITAVILHKGLLFKGKFINYLFTVLLAVGVIYGGYIFYITEDHTKELNELEEQLNVNEESMAEKQKEYQEKLQKANNDWELTMQDFQKDKEKLREQLKKLTIVGIGDSVMLGAVDNLYKTFPNGYFDAKISRTDYQVKPIITSLIDKNMLGDPIIFNLGTNGDCKEKCKNELLTLVGNKKVFWITVTNDNDVHYNKRIKEYADKHENVYVIDWETASKGHKDYFYADGIHLTPSGRKAYVEAILDGLYEVYAKDYEQKYNDLIKQHEEEENSKKTFVGDELLLGIYNYIKDDYKNTNYKIDKEMDYNKLITYLKETDINHNVILVLKMDLTNDQYNEIQTICTGKNIYIVLVKDLNIDKQQNTQTIPFYEEYKKYMLADKIHISSEGNKSLADKIKNTIKAE